MDLTLRTAEEGAGDGDHDDGRADRCDREDSCAAIRERKWSD